MGTYRRACIYSICNAQDEQCIYKRISICKASAKAQPFIVVYSSNEIERDSMMFWKLWQVCRCRFNVFFYVYFISYIWVANQCARRTMWLRAYNTRGDKLKKMWHKLCRTELHSYAVFRISKCYLQVQHYVMHKLTQFLFHFLFFFIEKSSAFWEHTKRHVYLVERERVRAQKKKNQHLQG